MRYISKDKKKLIEDKSKQWYIVAIQFWFPLIYCFVVHLSNYWKFNSIHNNV
jgi:hypothetical protein